MILTYLFSKPSQIDVPPNCFLPGIKSTDVCFNKRCRILDKCWHSHINFKFGFIILFDFDHLLIDLSLRLSFNFPKANLRIFGKYKFSREYPNVQFFGIPFAYVITIRIVDK